MIERPPAILPATGRIHLVGAGGAGMSSLAKILAMMGYQVSGSDLKPGHQLDVLGDLGIVTWVGHRPEEMSDVALLVASSAVPDDDPEVMAATAAEVTVWPRPVLLDALTAAAPAIGIAGTHGKTTSTALTVAALRGAGEDPSFVVGGEMASLNTGAHLGNHDLFVLEADEAFGTFLHLHLRSMLVTNVESDHLDYYGTVAEMEEAFALVANRTAGPVVGCVDDPGVRRLAERAPVIGYGMSPDADWRITDLTHGPGSVSFVLTSTKGHRQDVTVPQPGTHIARNAAGVLALLSEQGYDLAALAVGIGRFRGVRRRFEIRGNVAGVTVVDDYAHHPTEVGATIDAGRRGGWNRVVAVFQPHRYTRTADLAPEFGEPLAAADHVIVTDIYSAGERPLPGVSGRLIAQAVTAAGGTVDYIPSLHDVVDRALELIAPGDVLLLLGAGDITGLAEVVLTRLELGQAGGGGRGG